MLLLPLLLAAGAPDLSAVEPPVRRYVERLAERARGAPGSAHAWGALGGAYDVHGFHEEAARCYEKAREAAPTAFEWPYLLAIVREVDGADTAEVVARFEAARAIRPDYPALPVRLGAALAMRGEVARAADVYARAVELAPDRAVAWRGLGQARLALGELEAARRALTRAARLEPRDAGALTGLSQVLRMTGDLDAAADAARRARGLRVVDDLSDPVYAEHVTSRGRSTRHAFDRAEYLLREERFEEALGVFGEIAKVRDSAHVRYSIGSALARLGRDAEAARALEAALLLDPDHAWALYELGRLAERKGDLPTASAHLRRAVALSPTEPELLRAAARVWTNWGNVLLRAGEIEPAIDRYREAIRIDPDHANSRYNLGVALERAGRPEEARAQYREAVRIEPGHRARGKLGE